MIDKIVKYTNEKINSQSFEENNDPIFKPVNSIEIRGFIGLLLLFGVTKKNDIEVNEIWASDSLHHLGYATSAMPRDRFKFIACYLTFDSISNRDERYEICIH